MSENNDLDLNRPMSSVAIARKGKINFLGKVTNREERPDNYVPKGNELKNFVHTIDEQAEINFHREVENVTKIYSTTSVPVKQEIKTPMCKTEIGEPANQVSFIVSGARLNIDKAILAQKAPKLEAMIQNGKCEVEQTNLEPAAFEAMLQFLKVGKLSDETMKQFAKDLFVASKTYELSDLSEFCENFLIKTVQSSNSLDLLIWSSDNDADKLNEHVREYRKGAPKAAAASNNPTTTTTTAATATTDFLEGRSLNGVIIGLGSNIKARNISHERTGPQTDQTTNSINDAIISLDGSNIEAHNWSTKRTIEPSAKQQEDQSTEKSCQPGREMITFLVNDKQIAIDRETLAQKAPEFEVKYRNGSEFEIKEDNVDLEAFEAMLDFFKDGDVMIKPNFAINLLLVADDFKADSLKEHVFKHINTDCPNIESTDDFGKLRERPKLLEALNQSKPNRYENTVAI